MNELAKKIDFGCEPNTIYNGDCLELMKKIPNEAGFKRAIGMHKALGHDVAEIISATSFTEDTARIKHCDMMLYLFCAMH